jgi:class II lanthipeptide synthase
MDESEGHGYLITCLREELYYSFFCHGHPVPARWGEPQPLSGDPWLGEALSQANTGRGSWEPGWKIESIENEEALVATRLLRARVPLVDCRAPRSLRPGAMVSVRLPKEFPERSPGFYTAVGDAPADLATSEGIVRVYWNISGSGAAGLVRTLTARLNAQRVAFWLKVADHHVRLTRCDAAVLYVRSDTFQELGELFRDIAGTLTPHLRPQVPAFTLELAPGVGVAEDVDAAESFGVRRCALLADGIVRAHSGGLRDTAAQLAQVEARFAEDGVRMDAPYLEPSLAGRHVL